MPRELSGDLDGRGLNIGIAVARFNQFITQQLLEGARETLSRYGVQDVDIVWVPGSFELPVTAKTMAQTGRYDAVVCLGTIIRGETGHYDMVANQASSGINRVATETGVPIMFGVLTTENMEQAINRAGGKSGNLGASAAEGAVEMARVLRAVKDA